MSTFIKEAYYHYSHYIFPYVAALAMTDYNMIITINLSRKRTQSSLLLYGQWSFAKVDHHIEPKIKRELSTKARKLNLSI